MSFDIVFLFLLLLPPPFLFFPPLHWPQLVRQTCFCAAVRHAEGKKKNRIIIRPRSHCFNLQCRFFPSAASQTVCLRRKAHLGCFCTRQIVCETLQSVRLFHFWCSRHCRTGTWVGFWTSSVSRAQSGTHSLNPMSVSRCIFPASCTESQISSKKRVQHIYYWISPSFTSPHRLTVRWAVRPVSAFMLGTELANAEMKSVFLFKDGLISSASDQFANKCKGGRKCNGWVFSQDKGKTRNKQTQRNIRITGNQENDWTRRSDARKRMLPTINVEMLWLKVRKAFSWFPVISAHNLNLHTHTPVVHTSFLLMQLPSVDPS